MSTRFKTTRIFAILLMSAFCIIMVCCESPSTTKAINGTNDSTGGSSRDDKPELKTPVKATTKITPVIQPGGRTTTSDSTGGSSRDTTSLKKRN